MVALAQFNATTQTFESSPTQLNLSQITEAVDILMDFYQMNLDISGHYLDSVADTIIGRLYALVANPNIAIMYMKELLDIIVYVGESRESSINANG